MSRNPQIDAKIAGAGELARPILEHFRALVHQTIDGVDEAIKWGMPHYTYRGKNIAGMAAFKAHCAVIVHGAGRQGTGEGASEGEGMGSYGKVTSLADLPDDTELAMRLREARDRIDSEGSAIKRAPAARAKPREEIPIPDAFAGALAENNAATSTFDGLSPSQRREYLEWITTAKREETRAKRIAEAVAMLAEGKRRNWMHER